ncbi:hypothetical protein [Lacipirellula sp.]|uniref:hypothetical protein n=1 Tax=Lacipirellula sp. TaxID=2691419 RepID=UPI003D11A301
MRKRIAELMDAGYGVPKVALLLNITGTEVNMAISPTRYPNAVWADMLRREGFDNERIAERLDMKLSSVEEFFGERVKTVEPEARASGFVDVHWVNDKWQSSIVLDNGCRVTLHRSDDAVSAAWVRDEFISENNLEAFFNLPPERRRVPR